jgi:GNAT superfamily N-acetyltransferase
MAEEAMAFVGYDEHGDPVCTAAVQVWDFGTGTLKSEFENLRLLFGDRAEAQRGRWRTEALAPMAAEITGRAIYGGGYWVRPDWRGRGIGDLVPAMVRYAAFARWPLGLYVTLGSRAFLAPELRSFYDFTDCQPGMLIMDGDHLVFRGMLVWGRTSVGVDRLADRLSALTSATTPSARSDGGQRQPLPTATDDGHAQA